MTVEDLYQLFFIREIVLNFEVFVINGMFLNISSKHQHMKYVMNIGQFWWTGKTVCYQANPFQYFKWPNVT